MLIQPYQERWAKDFETLKSIISEAIEPLQVHFEHVGSTSVPFLAAKPIIDIDMVYDNIDRFNLIKNEMNKLGYRHYGDFGIEGREVFKLEPDQEINQTLLSISHHMYVCHKDNKELARHLAFRDYLKQNIETRIAYQELKLKIANLVDQDHKHYAELKEVMAREFIETILEKTVNH